MIKPRQKPLPPTEWRRRIERLFMAVTESDSPHGAIVWYANWTGIGDKAVYAWCSGDRAPKRDRILLLAYLEKDAGRNALRRGERARQQYYTEKHGE